jgi:hypothetical protein
MKKHTTPGTRRTWSTGQQWVAHLRALLGLTGRRAKTYTDLEAHMVACDRAFIRSLTVAGLEAIRDVLADKKVRAHTYIVPVRGQRAGSPYELIVTEVHNTLGRVHAARARHHRLRLQRIPRRAPVQLSFTSLWADAHLEAA